MQYHSDGYHPGDPDVALADTSAPSTLPKELDVLIVGAGSAGLTLAAYLANFPKIRTALVERKMGPLTKGQADGVSCRSMEMFQTFGFAEKVMREAYWVNEATFWKPDPQKPAHIIRSGRVRDVEDGLSEMPHVILNQARVHDMYLQTMLNAPTRAVPFYGVSVHDLSADQTGVTVALSSAGQLQTIRARYVVGCDGARSTIRRLIGQHLNGAAAHQAWGVMDILATTDFPDIRFKSLVQSAAEGTVLVIPREGGYLVRLYVELDKLNPDERVSERDLGVGNLIAAANRILHPYTIDVKAVVWWSVYEIGQRLCARFDDGSSHPHVFIAGDACHTHSPKAGQGMNVSMGDSFNLGWKLVHALSGQSDPELLASYSQERQAVAQALITFDQEWAEIMSAPPKERDADGQNLPLFQRYFIEHGRYTAGLSVRYPPSSLTGPSDWQSLAGGFDIGMRFHSAPVIRLADGRNIQLGHVQKTDARWLLVLFLPCANGCSQTELLTALCDALKPIIASVTPNGSDVDAVIDVRAVLQAHPHSLNITEMPDLVWPQKGALGLRDYEKVFCADPAGPDIYALRDIDRKTGAMVLVRPDQYVAHVLPPSATKDLNAFLHGVFRPD
jgi:phenol 2-monooxygenase